jgi:hypothetical protein
MEIKNKLEVKYKEFLDDLRESGITNMFGASSYLEDAFGLERKEAQTILSQWMREF